MSGRNNNRYTVVVSSCDKYEDLWSPFFILLKAEWPELEKRQIPIVLNTEHKRFELEGLNLKTTNLPETVETLSWTERLRKTLESVKTEYIIFLLDDFFMQDRVDSEVIDQCVNWMDSDSRISMFCFKETVASKNIRDNRYNGFERRPLFGQYKFNCQAALWKRTRLIQYLGKAETPWEWETIGNWRSYRHPFHFFYSAIPGQGHVFPYIFEINGKPIGGLGILQGRWYFPGVENSFKKHGIEIDYSIRGIVSDDELNLFAGEKVKEEAPYWKQKVWFVRPLYNRVNYIIKTMILVLKHLDHIF